MPDALNKSTMAALSEAAPDARFEMSRALQAAVQESSPSVIRFQAASQMAMDKPVSG
ncbi:hypothetical protein [Marinovum sp.]|uniref:hypothetical protein n=1 Tax=Marinovum sp. TaxID=2024839 RepID=UPI002B27A7EB|nr:hypothetical protein [Marinovum sp.]